MNIAVLEELEARFPGADYAFLESGGDNLTLTFSPELVDHSMYVLDVAGGDKVPRKRGPGVVAADLLVINKTDLASHVGADLSVLAQDSDLVRAGRPSVFTDCRHGPGIESVVEHLESARRAFVARGGLREAAGAGGGEGGHRHEHPHPAGVSGVARSTG
jgi:urease accessory protein